MATKKQTRAAGESTLLLLVLGGIVVLVNLLGLFLNFRLDTTSKELFSLSSGSARLAASLDDQMEIRAYFSPDLPPPHNSTERYVRDLLSEYRDASGGKVVVRFIAPETDEEKAQAETDGIQKVADQRLEADSFTVHEGYRGVSFHYLGDTKALARVDTTAGLEYEITMTIKQLAGEKTEIGVLGGHEGPSVSKGLTSIKQYLPTYNFTEVTADKPIDKKLRALLIVHPETPLTETELRYVDQYVMNGGSLGIFGGGVKVAAEQAQGGPPGDPKGTPIDSGLNAMLSKWGIKVGKSIVADAQCGRARLPTRLGIPIAVPYPPVPIVSFDEKQAAHPAMFRLDQVGLPYPVPLTLDDTLKGDKDVKTTVLARSTEKAWLMKGDSIDLASRQRWEVPGYDGPYILGIGLEGKLPSAFADVAVSAPAGDGQPAAPIDAPARATASVNVLVLGSGFFINDMFLPPPAPGRVNLAGGVAFALNAIDWLAQDSDLVEIRAKNVEDPTLEVPAPVKEAEATIRTAIDEQDENKANDAFEERRAAMVVWDQKKQIYKWGNTLMVPALFALFGVLRWRVRKQRRAQLKL